jgi:hypothetical protein
MIALVVLLAAASRMINAGAAPIWTDEGASIFTASDHDLGLIVEKLIPNHHPPLYFAALSGWWTLAGDSRLALRLLSILGGVLATAAVYRAGRETFGHRAGFYGALLFAVSDLAIEYAQQVRHYSWLVLAVSLMSLTFARVLRRPSWRALVPYTLTVVFMLYTHYLGLMILAVQGAVALVLWRAPLRERARLLIAWGTAALLYAPWAVAINHLALLFSEGGMTGRPNISPTSLDTLVNLLNLLAGGQTALLAGLFALALWAMCRRLRVDRLYFALAGGGLLAAMFVLNLWVRVLTPRTLVFLTPALLLVCGYGLSLLSARARLALAGATVAFALVAHPVIQPRLNSVGAGEAIAAHYTPGDLIVLETGFDDNAMRYEIARALDIPMREIIRTLPWISTRFEVKPVVPEIEDTLEDAERVWVVQWLQPPQVIPFLDTGGAGYAPALAREIPAGDAYAEQFHAPIIHVRLYAKRSEFETPFMFGDLFALRGALLPESAPPGTTVPIDLWWTAEQAAPLDYSVGVFLLEESGAVVAEHNAPPGETPTTAWTPGTLTFDRHPLAIPAALPPGTYRIAVKVYWYADADNPLLVDGETMAVIGEIDVSL